MVEELVSPDLTKSNTTTASTSQRKVLKVWLQDPFQVYQLPEPKLAVLESVGGYQLERPWLKSGVVSPDLTKSNTTTASTSQRRS
jgi:hypothetical protein